MLYKTIFVTVTLFIVGSNSTPTKFRSDEPMRCCMPEQFSAQVSTSIGLSLPDGKGFGGYVKAIYFIL